MHAVRRLAHLCLNAAMFRPFPLFIGWRYMRARRRRTRFISVVSAVALLGLALGVMALLVVLSVMNGFDRELRTRILSMVPHVLVHAAHPFIMRHPMVLNQIDHFLRAGQFRREIDAQRVSECQTNFGGSDTTMVLR